jgi:hypothetical protein
VTALELNVNFIRETLPLTTQVLKLAMQARGGQGPFVEEESDICRKARNLMEVGGVLTDVSLHMRPELPRDPGLGLLSIAHRFRITDHPRSMAGL